MSLGASLEKCLLKDRDVLNTKDENDDEPDAMADTLILKAKFADCTNVKDS